MRAKSAPRLCLIPSLFGQRYTERRFLNVWLLEMLERPLLT